MNKLISTRMIFDETLLNSVINYLNSNRGKNKAIVLDIDDTMIMTSGNIYKSIKLIYDHALRNEIKVFIITARVLNNPTINFTKNQLVRAGYQKYEGLYLMPRSYMISRQIQMYKYTARQLIKNKNYDIILNIGDQWTDLYRQYYNYSSLPNKIYVFASESEGIKIKLRDMHTI